MHGCGESVVGALAAIHMVVRMNRSLGAHLPTKDLNGTITDHLGQSEVVLLPSVVLHATKHHITV